MANEQEKPANAASTQGPKAPVSGGARSEELSETELDNVAGGACATGEHLKEATITTR